MRTCFVIQPFDSGKFDKRFEEVYKPALKDVELEPYRVDKDPSVEVPIEAIEEGIAKAAICLADITTDNPNVWYELGYAFASDRPVIMICSDERQGKKYPFDIQHRTVISYSPESPSDFQKLREQISGAATALLEKAVLPKQPDETEQAAPREELGQGEITTLKILAGQTAIPESMSSLWILENDAKRDGLTSIGFGLALRKLVNKGFVATGTVEHDDGSYEGTQITLPGWEWIENNKELFVLRKDEFRKIDDEEVPF